MIPIATEKPPSWLTKTRLLYDAANKSRFFRACLTAAAGGASASFAIHPILTSATLKDMATASLTACIFAGLNFIRNPQKGNETLDTSNVTSAPPAS